MIEDTLSLASDSLSTALMKVKLRASVNVALDAAGSWAIDFPALHGFTLNAVYKGECWLSIKGLREKIRLRVGDCFLLTGGSIFTLATKLSLKKRLRAEQLFAHAQDGIARCNGGGDFFVAGTIFRFEGHLPSVMFGRLPPVIYIDGSSDQAAVLRWTLERFSAELRGTGAGRSLILSHLAPIILLQTLRLYLSSTHEENWLIALSHPKLSKVFEAIHSDYQRGWSLQQLASLASMSRSGFALMFKRKVGISPMSYLMNWRMQIACEMLETEDETLSAIASAVGYGSESAFSAVFNKVVKCRPGAYRKPAARLRQEEKSPAAVTYVSSLLQKPTR